MGSGMFSHMIPDAAHWVTGGLFPGPGGGRQVGVNGGPYAGVAPTLAGANAGYGGAVQAGLIPTLRRRRSTLTWPPHGRHQELNMGTHFFAGKSPQIGGGAQNMEARAIGSGIYAARGAAAGAQKDIGAAMGINKAANQGVPKRTAAYAPGPKKT